MPLLEILFYTLEVFWLFTIHKYIELTKILSNKLIMLNAPYEKTKNAPSLKANKFSSIFLQINSPPY